MSDQRRVEQRSEQSTFSKGLSQETQQQVSKLFGGENTDDVYEQISAEVGETFLRLSGGELNKHRVTNVVNVLTSQSYFPDLSQANQRMAIVDCYRLISLAAGRDGYYDYLTKLEEIAAEDKRTAAARKKLKDFKR